MGPLLRRMLCAAVVLAACSTGGATTGETQLTLVPNPDTSDTLLPVITDAVETDDTGTLPPNALFGGDLCSALENSDLAFLGRVRDTAPVSIDACQWTVGSGVVLVQLATPDEFARPGTQDEEIAPVDGVGLDAIGVAHSDSYQVYVQVENGFFSVTAATRSAAERLAAAAAPRATASPPPPTTSEPTSSTDAASTTT